jgi:acyl CoA:acetate/3-ketoacid CoA transferase beta subunit
MSVADHCAVAIADAFAADGRAMASPMAPMPKLGARLAKATVAPELVLTDGQTTIVDLDGTAIGWMPFTRVFDTLWAGRRHVMMGATQIDRWGNQNLSLLGNHARPKVQLLGSRGAPGNTVHHPTSYWVARHSARVFVPDVDFASGVGPRRGAHEIRVVVTNLGVFDFRSPDQGMRLTAVHPGVTVDDVVAATGFPLHLPDAVPTSRAPTAEEAAWLDRLDPGRAIRGD